MIDLKKIEQKIETLLQGENSESLTAWIQSYKLKALEGFLGEGDFVSIQSVSTKAISTSGAKKFQKPEHTGISCGNFQIAA